MKSTEKIVRVKNGSGPTTSQKLGEYREARTREILKLSWSEANKKLDRGELSGTPAEGEIKSLRFLGK